MTVKELLELVKAAEGPDRDIDARVAVVAGIIRMIESKDRGIAFFEMPSHPGDWAFLGGCMRGVDEAYRSLGQCLNVPAYTSSVDAILALIEAKLPGWFVSIGGTRESAQAMIHARTLPHAEALRGASGPMGQTMPLALCAAFLSALDLTSE